MTAKHFRCLDLFCGAGGSSMGLYRAGFDVTGVDWLNQPRYPFKFRMANALHYPLEGFDFIWASPPCQGYSIMRNLPWNKHRKYPLLIDDVRKRLNATGCFFAIENVMGARFRAELPTGLDGGYLCGVMFGLPFYRHRIFECNFLWIAPSHEKHEAVIRVGRSMAGRARDCVFPDQRHRGKELTRRINAGLSKRIGPGCQIEGGMASLAQVREAMGIDWMRRDELTQAIPPCYSEFIGKQAIEYLRRKAESVT